MRAKCPTSNRTGYLRPGLTQASRFGIECEVAELANPTIKRSRIAAAFDAGLTDNDLLLMGLRSKLFQIKSEMQALKREQQKVQKLYEASRELNGLCELNRIWRLIFEKEEFEKNIVREEQKLAKQMAK